MICPLTKIKEKRKVAKPDFNFIKWYLFKILSFYFNSNYLKKLINIYDVKIMQF